MICENCQKENPEGAVFCSFCGQKLIETAQRRSTRREKTAVSGTGRKQPIPDRPSAVVPRGVSTLIPRRKRADDMFFDDIQLPDEDPYDDGYERDRRSKRRSIIAGIVLLGVMAYVFWFLILPGGQEFRARIGWTAPAAPAAAYSRLGDQSLEKGDVPSAADYYYDALLREPDNFDYTFDVATSQRLLGDYKKSISAFSKCLVMNPQSVEAYKGISDVFVLLGDKDNAVSALMTGFNKTGDLSLFRAYQQLNA